MPEKVLGIREVLAQNLKINRQRCGLTQEKLAEKAGISAHYLAMVEVARKFPSPEMLNRLAQALDIETYKLFEMSTTPEEALKLLRQDIVNEIEQLVVNAMNNRRASPAVSKNIFVVRLMLLIHHGQNMQITHNTKTLLNFPLNQVCLQPRQAAGY
jgi:transcriptional regulator with XRE-family HTH domain